MRRDTPYRQRTPIVWVYRYKGQPRSEWPAWLRKHYSGPVNVAIDKQVGRIAVAATDNGKKEFWRWFNPGVFRDQYELASLRRRSGMSRGRWGPEGAPIALDYEKREVWADVEPVGGELLPCPFCKSIAELPFENLRDCGDEEPVKVWTMHHYCRGIDIWIDGSDADECAQNWNTRAQPPLGGEPGAGEALVERTAEAIYQSQRGRLHDQSSLTAQRPWRDKNIPTVFEDAKAALAASPLAVSSETTKSAPAVNSSLPSGESDPSVTTDCAGADTRSSEVIAEAVARDCAATGRR